MSTAKEHARRHDSAWHQQRVAAAAYYVETVRDQLQDAITARNAAIVEAREDEAGSRNQIASWAQLTGPMVDKIMAEA